MSFKQSTEIRNIISILHSHELSKGAIKISTQRMHQSAFLFFGKSEFMKSTKISVLCMNIDNNQYISLWFSRVFQYHSGYIGIFSHFRNYTYTFIMIRKFLLAFLVIILSSFLVLNTEWVGNFFRIRGFFTPIDTWPAGHPGKVIFDIWVSNSGYAPIINIDGYLSWVFWLGNVWWATFNHGVANVESARIVCPDNVFRDASIVCPATGFAWSENGGWIALSGSFINGGSGMYYNPSNGLIEGFGHSSSLGYIPFYGYASSPVDTGAIDQTGILLDGVGVNFIGKIAIIGNVAGSRIYNLTNQNIGYIYKEISQANILNVIHKNVALITRNIPSAILNLGTGLEFIYQKQNNFDYDTSFGWTWPAGKRTIIVEGRDIVLNQVNIGDGTTTRPRALIALKDSNGNGGNIIITKTVERIYTFLYAEGSIYSGEKADSVSPIVPYILSWAFNIPAQQIYIKWGIISKNTIGGSLQFPSVCPVVITNCTTNIAQLYDVNYFRTYDYTDTTQKSIPYDDIRFEKSAIIIEYDPKIPTDPPPWFQSVIQ